MGDGFRVSILCEDRRTERFLRKLCERFKVAVIDVQVSPKAKGSASAWVMARYPQAVGLLRSKKHQRNLGLLVHVDGDNQGFAARKRALDDRLVEGLVPVRAHEDRVALFVPTWSIETWLLHLSGLAQPAENERLKPSPHTAFRDAIRVLDDDEFGVIRNAVAAWPGSTSLPSLLDASAETRRIGIP